MYRKILVPVDGSEVSNLGLTEAVRLAKTLGSTVRLLHVVNELILVGPDQPGFYYAELIESLREAGKAILKKAESVARGAGLEPETVLLESIGGGAADFIIEQAKKWRAELIVMGTHGRRGIRRLVMGSDAEHVLRTTPVPVLMVRSTKDSG